MQILQEEMLTAINILKNFPDLTIEGEGSEETTFHYQATSKHEIIVKWRIVYADKTYSIPNFENLFLLDGTRGGIYYIQIST